uniref:Uncharacterized protein n=1 Tax=Poecilia latipinna TaxID=48699 RepID=A0A3B3TM17_9TELE
MNRLAGASRRARVEGGQLGGDEWTRHGSFVNKPIRGWLHSDNHSCIITLFGYLRCENMQPVREHTIPGSREQSEILTDVKLAAITRHGSVITVNKWYDRKSFFF